MADVVPGWRPGDRTPPPTKDQRQSISDLKVKLYDENLKKYEIDLNYESSNYSSCIVVVNSI